MSRHSRIALDAMGGDGGPAVTVPASLDIYRQHPDVEQILVGDRETLETELRRHGASEDDRLRIRHCSQVVAMDELPSKALRNKKDSSMRVAIDLVKGGEADAAVSAGNTGALMATARFVLRTLPYIDRPAIIARMPTAEPTYMLDLGANAECTPEQLYQFAVMGSVLAEAAHGIAKPTVGLLNIGEEELKGVERIRRAGALLQSSRLHYVGFVEGDDIYAGRVNVVVCDGFNGNVALKASEGLARLLSHYIREEYSRNWYSRLAALASYPVLKALRQRMDPRAYNGASLLGLQGIAIKSHGGADRLAFANAIRIAIMEVEQAVPQRIGTKVVSALASANEGSAKDAGES